VSVEAAVFLIVAGLQLVFVGVLAVLIRRETRQMVEHTANMRWHVSEMDRLIDRLKEGEP